MADKTSKAMSVDFGSLGCELMLKEEQTENRIDRLSDLPDAVLCHIVSFLPYKDAVRTSVLSTRWKYLFASIPCIDIGNYFVCLDDAYVPATFPRFTKFMDFLDRVLLFRSSCVSRFCLSLWGGVVDTAHVCRWVSALLRRGISELNLSIRTHHLPASMFTCQTLKVLKLHIDKYVIYVPTDVCFPNLKILHLYSVIFPDDVSAERLFSACLVLEDLVIRRCDLTNISNLNIFIHTLKRLTITHIMDPQACDARFYHHDYNLVLDTPMLVYFHYDDNLARSFSFTNMGSLEEAYVRARQRGVYQLHPADYHTSLLDLMKGISNSKSLDLSICSLLFLGDYERSMPTFHNLINLTIDASGCCSGGLLKLLLDSPGLETVTITLGWFNDYYRVWLQHEEMRFCSFSPCLKTINVYNFACRDGQMQLVKFLIENAEGLRNLNFHLSGGLSKEEERIITMKLMTFRLRSCKCQLKVVNRRRSFHLPGLPAA